MDLEHLPRTVPHATQIVDRFHVKENLHRVAQAVYCATSNLAKKWHGADATNWMQATFPN